MRHSQPTPRPGTPRRHPRRIRRLDGNRRALRLLSGRQGILAGTFMVILLAAVSVGLAGAGRFEARQAHLSGQERVLQARLPASLPAEGHWVDTTDNTVYQARLQPNSDGFSTFAFTTPLGQQVLGDLPLVTLSDGTLAQGEGISPTTPSLPSSAPARCLQGTLQGNTTVPILFTFLAHISSDGLAAFATLSFANPRDTVGTTNLCKLGQGTTGVTTYQLAVGCTLAGCTDLATLAGPSVANHDGALLKAEQNGSVNNWRPVYQMTSRQVTAQYSLEGFAALLNQQVKSVGKITAISTPAAAPEIAFTPEGQAYFSVQQTVTYRHNGNSHTKTLTSYYVLENGAWLFWFSE
jgi:hypothetical protein